MVKNPPAGAGDIRVARDVGLSLGLGRSPGEELVTLPSVSCLGNAMDRGTWWATVHRVTESDTTQVT